MVGHGYAVYMLARECYRIEASYKASCHGSKALAASQTLTGPCIVAGALDSVQKAAWNDQECNQAMAEFDDAADF